MQQKNVIIAGSTKCGTTSLFQYLSIHPQICSSLIKETRFFWDDEYELEKPKLNGKEVKNYSVFFSGCSPDKWKLEATPDYMYSASSAEKIKAALPDCKIIFILRDPLQRIISWYKYAKQTGRLQKDLEPEDYIKLLSDSSDTNSPQHLRALEQGKYAKYLQPYLNLFGRENLLITMHRDLENDPKTYIFNVCFFLGLEKSFYDNYEFRRYNPSLKAKSVSGLKKYINFKKKLRSYNNRLPSNLRFLFKRILKPVDLFYLKTNSSEWEKISLSSFHKKKIADYYQHDHELLESILGKKITW
jgi:hypothetical protein